jgi:hypothetical protein
MPTHGSWLNLIEGFFSKLARSVLRQIGVAAKRELRERLMAFIEDLNREPSPPHLERQNRQDSLTA